MGPGFVAAFPDPPTKNTERIRLGAGPVSAITFRNLTPDLNLSVLDIAPVTVRQGHLGDLVTAAFRHYGVSAVIEKPPILISGRPAVNYASASRSAFLVGRAVATGGHLYLVVITAKTKQVLYEHYAFLDSFVLHAAAAH